MRIWTFINTIVTSRYCVYFCDLSDYDWHIFVGEISSWSLSLTFSSSIYTWKMLVTSIWCWYPVIGYPLTSSSDVTASVQSVWISLPKPLVFGVEQVIVPHDRCASFRCDHQIGFLAVITEIERVAFLSPFRYQHLMN